MILLSSRQLLLGAVWLAANPATTVKRRTNPCVSSGDGEMKIIIECRASAYATTLQDSETAVELKMKRLNLISLGYLLNNS